MVYSRSLARPVASVVGDIYHFIQLYVGSREADGNDRAFAVTVDGTRFSLTRREPRKLSESIVTNFLMRPTERFVPLSQQAELIRALDEPSPDGKRRGRIGLDFDGDPVSLDYGLNSQTDIARAMEPRQKFVAAGSEQLAREIVRALKA